MVSKYSGRCRCGNVTYTISGEPVWNMSCHCNWCQTTSGSAFRTFVLFKEKDLEISGDSFSSYEDTTTDHGRSMINQFCRNCGTQEIESDMRLLITVADFVSDAAYPILTPGAQCSFEKDRILVAGSVSSKTSVLS